MRAIETREELARNLPFNFRRWNDRSPEKIGSRLRVVEEWHQWASMDAVFLRILIKTEQNDTCFQASELRIRCKLSFDRQWSRKANRTNLKHMMQNNTILRGTEYIPAVIGSSESATIIKINGYMSGGRFLPQKGCLGFIQ